MRDILEAAEFEELQESIQAVQENVQRIIDLAIQKYEKGELEAFIAEIKKIFKRNRKKANKIIFRDTEKEELIGHEIGEPLMGIEGDIDMIKISKKQEEILRKINRLKAQIWAVINKSKGLVFWTKEKEPTVEEYSLDELLQEGKLSFDFAFWDEIELESEEELTAIMDRSMIATLLLSMCRNAKIKGNAQNMEIKAYREGRNTKIEVIDDGNGIDPEIEKRIFEYRFTSGGGKGIGLGDAEERLKAMGGSIGVNGHGGIDGGAKFTITLQAA